MGKFTKFYGDVPWLCEKIPEGKIGVQPRTSLLVSCHHPWSPMTKKYVQLE
jgi:hypothetical protein